MKKSNAIKLCILLLAALSTTPAHAETEPLKTIVLPFENITAQPKHQWIGKSFSENLTASLIPLKSIDILERTQIESLLKEHQFSQSMWADEKNTPEFGKLAGADLILLGSYEVVGQKLRVHVRLVNIETGKVDKKVQFDTEGELKDIFDIQTNIIKNLTQRFASSQEKENLSRQIAALHLTESVEAHRAYIEAVIARSQDDVTGVIQWSQKAIQADPNYVLPYLQLSNLLSDRYISGKILRLPISPAAGQLLNLKTNEDWIKKARSYWHTANKIAPEHKWVKASHVNLLYGEGKKTEALALLHSLEGNSSEQSLYATLFMNIYFDYGTKPITPEAQKTVYEYISSYLSQPEVFVSWVNIVMQNPQKKPVFVESLLADAIQRLNKRPENIALRFKVVEMQTFLKRPSQAIQTLREIDKLQIKSPLFNSITAFMFMNLKDFEKTEEYTKKALLLDPQNALAQSVQLLSYCAQQQNEACYSQAQKILQTYPEDINALVFSGFNAKKPDNERYLEKALQLLKKDKPSQSFSEADLTHFLSGIYFENEKFVQAIETYKRSGILAPTADKQAEAYRMASGTHYMLPDSQTNFPERIRLLKKALGLPVSAQMKTRLLIALSKEHSTYVEDYTTAHSLLQQALLSATPPQQQSVILAWAELLLEEHKPDDAERLLKEKYTQTKNPNYFMLKSSIFEAKDNYAAAATWYKKYMESDLSNQTEFNLNQYQILHLEAKLQKSPKNPDLLNDLGAVFLKSGYYDSAEKMFKQTLSIAPQKATVHYNLGTAYLMQEKWPDSIPPLKRAIELQKNYPAALYNLGFAYFKTDQKILAQQSLVQLKLLRPDYPGLKDLLSLL